MLITYIICVYKHTHKHIFRFNADLYFEGDSWNNIKEMKSHKVINQMAVLRPCTVSCKYHI